MIVRQFLNAGLMWLVELTQNTGGTVGCPNPRFRDTTDIHRE